MQYVGAFTATKDVVPKDQHALKAPLASPAFTGTPTAPTATAGTNNTQIATTAFVAVAVAGGVDGLPGKSAYQVALDNGFVGTEAAWLTSLQGPQGISFYQRRVQTITTVPVLGAITCDWNSYDEIRITLDANVTLTFSGGADGQGCTLKLKQDATGGRTVTLPASVRFNADITGYTNTATASKCDRVGFIHDAGDNKYDFVSAVKGF